MKYKPAESYKAEHEKVSRKFLAKVAVTVAGLVIGYFLGYYHVFF